MSRRRLIGRRGRRPTGATCRVGLFGLLGSGNIGNDASMESVLSYLRAGHPGTVVDAMCIGPGPVRDQYGIEAIPLQWYRKHDQRVSGVTAVPLKVLGKGLDAFRTARWVFGHDVVIVPGMGVLEASLPLRASGFPYAMFLLCASGKLFGTKVALVSVGATAVNQRLIRWLFSSAARLACYRSYRDVLSRDAMAQQGLDTTQDPVYPDLVFGLPSPPANPGDPMIVGVGVMDYFGGNDDRGRSGQIHASYVENMKDFIRWLVDDGRKIRLFVGDRCDDNVVQEILADLREKRPDLGSAWVVAEPVSSFAELTRAMEPVGTVVATRYHNVLCALRLAKPTISLGYAGKNSALMADMGLAGFCQSAGSLDLDRLIGQFQELENRSAQLRQMIADRCEIQAQRIGRQFAELSRLLFPTDEMTRARAKHQPLAEASNGMQARSG
jgi:polysaccharide pyruvyl transferase WcaK-like protein